MKLAENLKYYRESHDLTQDAVANELKISRQSVSKWENGESYPSIDNLIILRQLFNLSIDELIMGEKFMSLPFIVGKDRPARTQFLKRPLAFSCGAGLILTLSTGSILSGILAFIIVFILSIFFFYPLSVDLLYQNWVLDKTTLYYLPTIPNLFALWPRTMAILTKKEETLLIPLAYSDISSVELVYETKAQNIFLTNPFQYNLAPLYFLALRDPLYFLVKTTEGQSIKLDLTIDFYHQQRAYHYLNEIRHFFESKNIPVKDPLRIIAIQQEHYRLYDYMYTGVKRSVK